jgi:tetratricopeptide (TPR) repeat protein
VVIKSLLLLSLTTACATLRNPVAPEPASEEVDAMALQLQMAEALIRIGSYTRALDMVGRLRAQGYDSIRLDQVQGEACNGQQLFDETILLMATLQHRTSSESQRLLGLAYAGSGQLDDAVLAFDRAVRRSKHSEHSGRHATLHNNLGFALAAAGRHQDALASYRRAIALEPTLGRARNNLGFSLAALNRNQEALASFEAAARLDPRISLQQAHGTAFYNLGLAQGMNGEPDAARDSYAAALDAWPDHEGASAALAALAQEDPKP